MATVDFSKKGSKTDTTATESPRPTASKWQTVFKNMRSIGSGNRPIETAPPDLAHVLGEHE
eukprot:14111296-Alexandrium_andersonii.AAC.1